MSAFLTLGSSGGEPVYIPWFQIVGQWADTYPLIALPELYFELECADCGSLGLDNWFVKNYNNVDDFELEFPDD